MDTLYFWLLTHTSPHAHSSYTYAKRSDHRFTEAFTSAKKMFEDGIIDEKEFEHIKSVMQAEDKKITEQIEQSFHSPHACRHSKFGEKKARRFSHAKTEAPQHHHHHHNESFSHADTAPSTSPRRWSHQHHPVTHTQSFNMNKNTRKRASSLSPRAKNRRGSMSHLLVRTNSEHDSVMKSFSDPPLRKAKRVSSSDATPKKLLVRTPSIIDSVEGKTLRVTIHHLSEVPVSPKKDKGSSKSNKSRQYIARVKYGNEKKVTSKCKSHGHEAPKWTKSEGTVSFVCNSKEDNLSIEILRKRTIRSDLVLGVSTLDLHPLFKSSEKVLSQTSYPIYVQGEISSSKVTVTLELVS